MKRIDKIRSILDKTKGFLDKGAIDLTAQNDSHKYTDFFNVWGIMNEFEEVIKDERPKFSEPESKMLNEIGHAISEVLCSINFNASKDDSLIIPFMEEWFIYREENDTVQKKAKEILTYTLYDNFDEYRDCDNWYDVAFLLHAYVFFNILIERKELTKELYDLLFPYLYRQKDEFRHETKNLIPIIPLSRYKNDYAWLKDIDEEADALAHIVDGDMSIDVVFGLYDGVKIDKNDDDGASNTPVVS